MAIRVECDECFVSHNVPDERRGQAFKCRGCGKRLMARPARSSAAGRGTADESAALPPRRRRSSASETSRRASSGGGGSKAIIAGGVIAAIAVVGVGGTLLIRSLMTGDSTGATTTDPAAAPAAGMTGAPAPEPSLASSTMESAAPVATGVDTPATPNAFPEAVPSVSAAPAPAVTSAPASPSGKQQVAWNLTPDPGAGPVTSLAPRLNLPYSGDQDGLLYPATPSAFMLAGISVGNIGGAVVVDLTSGKAVGSFPVKAGGHSERALSPDGRYVAAAVHNPRGSVELWTPQGSQPVRSLPVFQGEDQVSVLAFRSPDQLVVAGFTKDSAGKIARQLHVIDVNSGTTVSRQVTDRTFSFENYVLTGGGRYFLSMNPDNTLVAFDLDAGTLAGEITLPKTSEHGNHLSAGGGQAPGIAVTDDGQQLCVLQTSSWETQLLFLDLATGREVEKLTIPGRLGHMANNDTLYQGPKIQLLKDGEFILLDGQVLIHRRLRRLVWNLTVLPTPDEFQLTNNGERRVLGDQMVLSDGPRSAPVLQARPIPFDRIESALARFESGEPAGLTPPDGQVSVVIDVAAVRFGDPAQTQADLLTTLRDRLAAEGLNVTEGASAVLKLQYAEGEGNTLSLSQYQPGVPRSQQTPNAGGQSLQSTKAMMKLTLSLAGKNVWEKEVALDPSVLIFRGDATAQAARDSVFKTVQETLYGTPVVWYVSSDQRPLTLPIQEALESEAVMSGGRRPTRRPGR